MDAQRESAHPNTERKLVVNLPEELLTSLRSSCAEKASFSLLGRIQGKHPGLKALTAWARETLHPSLALLSLKAHNLFEVTFHSTEGRIHALTQAELVCEHASIHFSSWRPHYDSRTAQGNDQLDFPIWMQIIDLCQILRDEALLRAVGEHIGQVIAVDTSEAYRAKLFGPRVRLLVKNIDDLPHTVVLPRLDGEGVVEYNLEFSGLPNQCGRCRSRDHQVRFCPKKDSKPRRREHPTRNMPPPNNVPTQEKLRIETETPPPQTEPQQPAASIEDKEPPTRVTPPADPHLIEPEQQEAAPKEETTRENSQDQTPEIPPELQPNEENFPQLRSPGTGQTSSPPHTPAKPQPATPPTFI